ncbi:hypothetical protein Lser_V15G26033 [Lactuca serriola]
MRKRKKIDRFVFLHDDILFNIFKRLPDALLRYRAKYVSRRWFRIITNRILLDHASFILQKMGTFTARHVDIREEGKGLQVKEQHLDIPCIGRIMSWCNEFLLISDDIRKESLYVFNLVTKKGSYLPQCNASCVGHSHYARKCGVVLSFDGFKGIYKVVHLFMGPPIQCHIHTLRKDIVSRVSSKWKKMEIPYMNEGQHYSGDPVSIQGRYFYWDIYSSNHLVFMDIVSEKIFQISLPGRGLRRRCEYSLFVMGGFLALFDGVSWDKAEIWILKDLKMMKWEKLHIWSFRVSPGTCRYPVSGVISKRHIILKSRVDNGMYSYDVKYELVKELDIHVESDDESCVVHSSAPSYI